VQDERFAHDRYLEDIRFFADEPAIGLDTLQNR
jgi:hypothetical protein